MQFPALVGLLKTQAAAREAERLAVTAFARGECGKAAELFEAALAASPDNVELRNGLQFARTQVQ